MVRTPDRAEKTLRFLGNPREFLSLVDRKTHPF
jgi:hypothetical protein